MERQMKPRNAEKFILYLAGISMLCYWILFALAIPMDKEYLQWVLDSDWVWVNSIGFTAAILGCMGLCLVNRNLVSPQKLNTLFYGMTQIGIIFLIAILFFESFVQKEIALRSPDLVHLKDGIQGSLYFKFPIYLGSLFLILGISGFFKSLYSSHRIPRWLAITFCLGTLLFGLVVLPGNLRLIGVLLYSISMIRMGTYLA